MNGGAAAGAALAGFAAALSSPWRWLRRRRPALWLPPRYVGPAATSWLQATGTPARSAEERDSTGAVRARGYGPGGGRDVSSWTPQRVLDAMAAMEWQPDGAVEVRTDDYRLIRYPDSVLDPAFPAAQVTWSRAGRPGREVIDEVIAQVRDWGLLGWPGGSRP